MAKSLFLVAPPKVTETSVEDLLVLSVVLMIHISTDFKYRLCLTVARCLSMHERFNQLIVFLKLQQLFQTQYFEQCSSIYLLIITFSNDILPFFSSVICVVSLWETCSTVCSYTVGKSTARAATPQSSDC